MSNYIRITNVITLMIPWSEILHYVNTPMNYTVIFWPYKNCIFMADEN